MTIQGSQAEWDADAPVWKRCDFGPGYGAGRTLSVRQVPNRPIGGVDFPAFDEHPRPVRLVSLEFVIQICGDQRCGSARSQRIPSLGRNLPRMVTISANPVLSLPRPLVDLDRRLAAARALICVLRNVGALGSWQRHNPGPLFVTEKRRAVDRRGRGRTRGSGPDGPGERFRSDGCPCPQDQGQAG